MTGETRFWQSPAVPALLLLFGLTFGFAITNIIGFSWDSVFTRAYYAILFLWGGGLAFRRRVLLHPLVISDWLFLAFLLWLLASLSLQEDNPAAAYNARLLPFLVLLPYCLGRLMQERDRAIFLRTLPWLGVILFLGVLDYWLRPANDVVYTRRVFFGVSHSPLLIGMLVSVAVIALAYRLLKENFGGLKNVALIAFPIFITALVFIAARGALIACAIVLTLLVLLMRHTPLRRRMILVGCIALSAVTAFYVLPQPQAEFYKRTFSHTVSLSSTLPEHVAMIAKIQSNPKCKAVVEGVSSVAIRGLLYTEALELLVQHPLTGIGATSFGDHSCGGPGSYPHSTVLQAFAELGIFGGIVLLALYATSFSSALRISAATRTKDEIIFWIALIAFFALTDQIYGSYFMAPGSFFMFGLVASFRFPRD